VTDRPESYIATHKVGRATVSQVNDGVGGWTPKLSAPEAEWRAALPQADANGYVENDHYTGLIQIGDVRILVDNGFDDPSPTSPWMPPRYRRTPGVTAGLAALGVKPAEITHVLFTHRHGDHVAGSIRADGTARFPNARHFLGRADRQPPSGPAENAASLEEAHLGGLDRLGLLDLVDGDREVVPGVTMIHAPGESPGHSIVRVEDDGARAYFVGDLFHFPCEVEHLDWVSPGRDPAAMRRSRERLLGEVADTPALVTYSHAPFPGWGRVTRRGGGYAWSLL
jgi:glyoxylase-like metal-dependent hydrolase (beta-lactamase superfamily II)